MRYYSVAEISEMLGTNQETVRRWIRNGELEAVQDSRKEGNKVGTDELGRFLSLRPRYAKVAALAFSPVAVLAGAFAVEKILKKAGATPVNDIRVNQDAVLQLLSDHLETEKRALKQKEQEVADLKSGIEKLQSLVDIYSARQQTTTPRKGECDGSEKHT